MHELFDYLLPYLTPSEQAVYLRLWRLSHGEGKDHCAIRYEDLAKLAHISRSTIKRTLKKLIQRKLVKVEWYTKRASVFTVYVRSLSPAKTIDLGITPKLYDLFEEEDRSLFLSCKRALSPRELKEIEEDAGDPRFL
jgi:predicted transcriptional regulator